MKEAMKRKRRKFNGRLAALILSVTVGISIIQKPANAFAADGGSVLTEAQLSENLVNPNRDYLYRVHKQDVQSVENIDGLYDYVVMPNLQGTVMPDTSHLKYLVIHETDNLGVTATAMANYSFFVQKGWNSTWIVDENTVVQGSDITVRSRTIGNTDFNKSDVSDGNSINIEIAVNYGADYMRAVANTIHHVRNVLAEYPQLKLARHYDAFSERDQYDNSISYNKLCPRIMLTEMSWWTWERFVYFATNPDLPIPFIDFNPEISSEIPSKLKSLDIMKEITKKEPQDDYDFEAREMLAAMPNREKWYGKNVSNEDVSISEEISISQEVSTSKESITKEEANSSIESSKESDFVESNQEIQEESKDTFEELNTIVEENEKEAKASSKKSLFVFEEEKSSEDFLVFNKYIELDTEKIFTYIKAQARDIQYSDEQLKQIVSNINYACNVEKFNPYIAIEMMNQYTGFLSFGGEAKAEYYNFGALRNKDGELIQYENIKEGTVAYIQFLKHLTSKDKLQLKCNNKDAIKAVKSRGAVKDLGDLTRALSVSENFIASIVNRVQNNF